MSSDFLTPAFAEVEVNGKTRHFYPISVKTAFRLRVIGKPLAKALSTLFTNPETDQGKLVQDIENKHEGTIETMTRVDPINPELAEIRETKRIKAIEEMVDTLTDPQTGTVLAEVIFDSLREDMPRNPSGKDLEEFINTADAPTFFQCLKGVGLANKKLFAPLVEKVPEKVKEVVRGRFQDLEAASSTTENTGAP